MNSQGFSFPPPPPPPPQSQQQPQPYNQQQHATYPSQYGQGAYGQRGGRSAGGHHRGRGRGYGNRGGGSAGRGGHYNAPSSAAPPSVGYTPMNYSGYTPPAYPNTPQAGTPQFSPPRPQGFQTPTNAAPFATPQTYPHPTPRHASSYQQQQGYEASAYAPSTVQPTSGYPSVVSNVQHAQSAQPPMMGPPMRWGFENGGSAASYHGPPRGNHRGPRAHNAYGNQPSMGGNQAPYTNKRDYKSAFGKPQSVGPRVPAPPPVPSFGNPLPSKPPPPADATRKPKKKKRKHNQLGLTPKAEEHESSEEEDDVDEESRLAAGGAGPSAPLSITYRGRTSTLQSPADIAAWIEERKKRFPTQARVEEKKRAMDEAKKAREETARQRQEMRRAQKDTQSSKDKPPNAANPVDEAAKAKQKADKLRRKLLKEQKRVEKAEADAERARMKVEELQKATSASLQSQPQRSPAHGQGLTPDQETQVSVDPDQQSASGSGETSTTTLPEATSEPKPAGLVGAQENDDIVISSSDSDNSDWTSSSGSDGSSSDSDESDDDSAPEQATSRREGPERVAPPSREVKKRICRHFARNGRCQRGDKCKFLHEKPERGPKSKPQEKQGRKGLLQALLGRQKQDEDRHTMDVIVWMGENGLLEQKPDPQVGQLTAVANGSSDITGVKETIDDNNKTQASEGPEEPAPEQAIDIAASNA